MPKTKYGEVTLEDDFNKIINTYMKELGSDINVCLNEVSEEVVSDLSLASPVDEESKTLPHFKDCWKAEIKYNGVKYVGNTKLTPKRIPLSNLIEYSSKNTPFIGSTFKQNENKYFNSFKEKLRRKIQ